MNKMTIMKRNKRSTSDIISHLPSNVTGNILKGLPLRDAVRTSVLSRKWRYKWVTLPELVFNDKFFLEGWDNGKVKGVIYQVLLFHRGPLVKFNLWYRPLESCLDINNWIFVLSMKNIQDFTFSLHGGPRHEIPCHFYSFMQLRDLDLEISVTLGSWDKRPEQETDIEWAKFFHSLPAIEDMHLDSSILESFDAGNVPERLPSTLDQLKVLVLSDVCYFNLDHVSWALCLLRSSPNLHKLRSSIMDNDITPIEDNVTEFLQAQDFSKFSLNRLREVEIRHFSGAEAEMHFVKILLAHSKVLEKMAILHEHGMCAEKGFAMVKELIRFPRASLKAEFIVSETPDE
ncbi:F-box/FBD/LRR-repeat protein At1g13570-like isoform X1 [Rhododendron vialii]|uniref:F-box/FBD/LRR-repeat protein At1g13570-like isoform X1 n=2 Tax=Rhododendron vialii TaxID=182163 RepID=UPI00265DB7BB|nr:F-box/FBD/LRR-repeat protein At1g13570-like isoform X1 [Rhododendron vialii]